MLCVVWQRENGSGLAHAGSMTIASKCAALQQPSFHNPALMVFHLVLLPCDLLCLQAPRSCRVHAARLDNRYRSPGQLRPMVATDQRICQLAVSQKMLLASRSRCSSFQVVFCIWGIARNRPARWYRQSMQMIDMLVIMHSAMA